METTNTQATLQGESTTLETGENKVVTPDNGTKTETNPKAAQAKEKQEETKVTVESEKAEPDLAEDYKRRLEALEARELKADATELMKQEGLPLSCLDFVLKSDMEQTKSSMETFKQVFQEAVADAVKEKLKGTTPPQGNFGNTANVDTEASIFAKALNG